MPKITIDELVKRVHSDYVSVDNCPSGCTGKTLVESAQIDIDVDGIHLYIRIGGELCY